MARQAGIAVLYVCVGVGVFLVWTARARTDAPHPPGPGSQHLVWKSLAAEVDGSAGKPFVRRRLLADGAWLLAEVIPASWWRHLAACAEGSSAASQAMAWLLARLGWPTECYSLLFSGYLLIGLATLASLPLFARLLRQYYVAPAWMLHLSALLFGLAILGGQGPWNSYPYDIPNLFATLLALVAIKGGSRWTVAAFAVAAYSKETSLLLLPVYITMRWHERKRIRFWAELAVMGGIYFGLRLWIERRFPGPEGSFWFLDRSLYVISSTVLGESTWLLIPAVVILCHLFRIRRDLPMDAVIALVGMAGAMVSLAFFKGWIEERRQYLELLPLAGVLCFRWAVEALGLDAHVRPVRPARLEAPRSSAQRLMAQAGRVPAWGVAGGALPGRVPT